MNVSEKGLNLIRKWEGCYLTAYRDPVGIWTIGYGTTNSDRVITGTEIKSGLVISKALADEWLRKSVEKKYVPLVNKYQSKYNFNQNQFDALVSFCYNVGSIDQLTANGKRSINEIASHITAYNKAGGKVLQGLTNRRNEELKLFNTPCTSQTVVSEPVVNQPVSNIAAHVTVTCETLNIRSGAGTNYGVVAQAHKGGEYDVFEIKGDWGRINGGWFNLKYTNYNKYTVNYYPACSREFVSLISALNSIGVNSSYDYRKKIAQKNNVNNYTGTAQQNIQLLEKLKAGRLIKI